MSVSEIISPTRERLNKLRYDSGTFDRRGNAVKEIAAEEPEKSRKGDRQITRTICIFEFLHSKGYLTGPQFRASQYLTELVEGQGRGPSITASYGQQRWTGTAIMHMSDHELMRLSRPERCRLQLIKARRVVEAAHTRPAGLAWKVLMHMAEMNLSMEEAGFRSGAKSEATAKRRGSGAAKAGLSALAKHWGMDK